MRESALGVQLCGGGEGWHWGLPGVSTSPDTHERPGARLGLSLHSSHQPMTSGTVSLPLEPTVAQGRSSIARGGVLGITSRQFRSWLFD